MVNLPRSQFFAAIAPIIMLVRQQGSPILPSVRLAQSLLETGGTIHAWNNLGGIKVGSGRLTPYWSGDFVTRDTWEFHSGEQVRERAAFRAYRTLYHYFKDQDELFKGTRYRKVRTAKTPHEQAEQMSAAGYATDPAYASKIIAIIKQNNLEVYDAVKPVHIPPKQFENASLVPVYSDQLFIAEAYYEQYTNYVPVRKLGEHFDAYVIWKNNEVYVNGEQFEVRMAGSVSYAKASELASLLNLSLEWDSNAKVLFVN